MHNEVKIPLVWTSAIQKLYSSSNLLLSRTPTWSTLLLLNPLVLQQGNDLLQSRILCCSITSTLKCKNSTAGQADF